MDRAVDVVVDVRAGHCFDTAQLVVLIVGAATPSRCSYAWASMTATSRERGCLRATSVRRGSAKAHLEELNLLPFSQGEITAV
jgi:hypothetical protein